MIKDSVTVIAWEVFITNKQRKSVHFSGLNALNRRNNEIQTQWIYFARAKMAKEQIQAFNWWRLSLSSTKLNYDFCHLLFLGLLR